MTNFNKWVVWKTIIKDEKAIKLPICPISETVASATDPETWTDYKTAKALCEKRPLLYKGLGFVLGEDDPFTIIDIDNFKTDNLEQNSILNSFNDTYIEKSVSGKGYHIICKAKKPGNKCRSQEHPNIEIYDKNRFIAITFDSNNKEIKDKQGEINSLYLKFFKGYKKENNYTTTDYYNELDDDKILEIAGNAKNGNYFKDLWSGNFPKTNDWSSNDLALCNYLAFYTGGDPIRIDRLFRQSGLYREKWEREDYRNRTIKMSIENCNEFYKPKNKKQIEFNISPEKVNTIETEDYKILENIKSLNDIGNAEIFSDFYRNQIVYSEKEEDWFIYKSGKWERADYEIEYKLKLFYNKIREEAKKEDNKQVIKWINTSGNSSHLKAIINLSKSLLLYKDEFNKESNIINCKNKTIDLKNRTIKNHNSQDYINKMTNCDYNEKAKIENSLFQKFLNDICLGNEERINYLQVMLGYSITGETKLKCAFFPWGKSDTGKSLLLNIIHYILGDYAGIIPYDLFYNNRNNNFGFEDIDKVRFAISTEASNERSFNAELFKSITSGDPVKIQRKYKKDITINPICKLWIGTNEIPYFNSDSAMKQRIKIIPFEQKFKIKEEASENDKIKDINLFEKLKSEKEIIFKWLVDGAIKYYQEKDIKNIAETQEMVEIKESYIDNTDPISTWIRDYAILGNDKLSTSEELFKSYSNYCNYNNIKNLFTSPGTFAKKLNTILDIKPIRKMVGNQRKRFWEGITLWTK